MKSQISQDLIAALAKTAPTATVAVATYDPGKHLSWLVMIVTLLVGLSQFFTTMVKNWGEWIGWWKSRWFDAGRFWRWIRGK